jgi:hypothetical protein
MAYYLLKAIDKGYELQAKDVTDLVHRDYVNDTKALYSGLDADTLIKILGDDVAGKIRKHDLAKLKNPQGQQFDNFDPDKQPISKPKMESKDDWRKRLAELKD